jgi:hypothetical protein
MLRAVFPPLCLLLALAMAIVSFSMIAFGGPEASIALHEARASGDERAQTAFETNLNRQRRDRVTMIVLLLVGSGVMTIVAFGSMRGPSHNRN